MKWKEISLEFAPIEIIDGDRGVNYPKSEEFFENEFCLFLNTGNVTTTGFDFSKNQFINSDKDTKLRKGKLKRNDLVLTTRGTLGNVGFYSEKITFENVRINSGMVVIRAINSEIVFPKFIYYSLRNKDFQDQILNSKSGSAQPQLPIGTLKKLKIVIPPLPTQQKIAAILSAYDDLIENNLKRIRLLEEAAQHLYREWFVRFRFPGWEGVKVVDGLPEGWERKKIKEICLSIDYGYTASATQERGAAKFLRITDIVPLVIDWAAVPFCEIPEEKVGKYELKEGDIVVARTGATVGYAKRLNKRHESTVFAAYLVRFRLKKEVENRMVGVFVESDLYKSYINSHVGGSAQPNANAQVLSNATIAMPPKNIQEEFRTLVEPIIDQKEILQIQNQKLKAARDLLLPRLMSGVLEV